MPSDPDPTRTSRAGSNAADHDHASSSRIERAIAREEEIFTGLHVQCPYAPAIALMRATFAISRGDRARLLGLVSDFVSYAHIALRDGRLDEVHSLLDLLVMVTEQAATPAEGGAA